MKIEKIRLSNFRSFVNAEIPIDNLTVFIGRNGAGKSTVLHALRIFFDPSSSIGTEDFYNGQTDLESFIEVEFGNLSQDEKNEFKSYLEGGKLSVRKVGYHGGSSKYFASANQIPKFASIRQESAFREKQKAYNALRNEDERFKDLQSVRSGPELEKSLDTFEELHPEMTSRVPKEEQFFGPPNVGGGKLDKYTRFVFVPAVRSLEDEIKNKRGSVYQLIDLIVRRKVDQREDITAFRKYVSEEASKLYSAENLTELGTLGEEITKELLSLAPNSRLDLRWGKMEVPQMPLPEAEALLFEDSYLGDVQRKGHGLQRSLIITLLKFLAQINQREDGSSPELILAIEEPELFLHPSRCRHVSNVLSSLAEKGKGNQVIYCTHSVHFLSLANFERIRLIRRAPSELTPPPAIVSWCSVDRVNATLAKYYGDDARSYTREGFFARVVPIMTSVVNEGFFADLVVIVEGTSDAAALWTIQERLNQNWSELGIVIVSADCKNNLSRPATVFRHFEIPSYLIWDGDKSENEESGATENKRLLSFLGQPAVAYPETVITSHFACYEDKFETELKSALGDQFDPIVSSVRTQFGYKSNKQVLKNFEGTCEVISRAYENGLTVPILEQVVVEITRRRREVALLQIPPSEQGSFGPILEPGEIVESVVRIERSL